MEGHPPPDSRRKLELPVDVYLEMICIKFLSSRSLGDQEDDECNNNEAQDSSSGEGGGGGEKGESRILSLYLSRS